MNLREAAQQALEALHGLSEDAVCQSSHHAEKDLHTSLDVCPVFLRLCAAITALKTALAEPVQEPVAWMYHGIRFDGTPNDQPSLIWRPEYMDAMSADKGAKATPLYTAPPQRKPLTDEEIKEIFLHEFGDLAVRIPPGWRKVVSAIEKAHGIGGQDESA